MHSNELPNGRNDLNIGERIKEAMLRFSGYLLPLATQAPGLLGWIGIMSLPLLGFLIAMFAHGPTAIVEAVLFFVANPLNPMNCVTNLGSLIAVASTLYLTMLRRRNTGLVMSGPYRYVRHPQYLGFLLLTSGLTAWSYWALMHTRGIGWLSPTETVALWVVILIAYVILGLAEEMYLTREFGEEYLSYKNRTGFLVPGMTKYPYDILSSVLILCFVTYLLILFAGP